MCIIAISKKGIRQPTMDELHTMWLRNPDGAGYMYFNGKEVEIHKGFMTWEDFKKAMEIQKFTEDDVVVYHFRIATQGGIRPEMTHPFPLTSDLDKTEYLNCVAPVGIAHNGIIRITSTNGKTKYSDTALFITQYLSRMITCSDDLENEWNLRRIESLAQSKLAILDNWGRITTIGKFTEDNGILYSNTSYLAYPLRKYSRA